MQKPRRRVIERVHVMPGRLRLRLRWLRDEEAGEAERLADHLAALHPSMEVTVRPWTGSVLCEWDAEAFAAERVIAAVRQHTRVAIVEEPGAEPAPEPPPPTTEDGNGSSIRSAVLQAFGTLNHEIQEATDGRLDLGALTGLSFLAIGAAELVGSRSVPAPPWFNMAWWAYRTFTISGAEAEGNGALDADPGDALA